MLKVLLLSALTVPVLVNAQNYHCKVVSTQQPVTLDTLFISAESIIVEPDHPYTFESETATISFTSSPQLPDSIEVCYRTLSPKLYEPIYNRPPDTYATGRVSEQSNQQSLPILKKEEIFSFSSVQSAGAITRGVTFGNRQNLFVNSSLNLQMEGQLTEDLNLSAVITDQNIPYQPEGNTQQIRDFDNVYISMYSDDFEVTAGDLVMTNPVEEGYFLKYYKNVQGINLKYNYDLSENWSAKSQVAGSIAKGQFASVVIEPIESVQGPYKLRGPNGERFIIILANSEKVYIDGKLLQRGFDRDYVIDYNLGEITFSNQVVITRFSRIRIDYEYADQYYSRSNINASQVFFRENAKVYFNYYREKDNPRSTLGFTPSEQDLDVLRAGDQNGLAEISGVEATEFSENAILYIMKDTLDSDNNPVTILAYTTDPEDEVFRVSFSEVGVGNGDYVVENTNSNGRIYRWVSPENGVPQGRFSPIQQIPTPNQKQLFVFGSELKSGGHETFFQEVALSAFDQNLYSPNDDSNNNGFAWKGGLRTEGRPLGSGSYKLSGGVDYEFDQRNFQAIDRFRSVDYDRDWSYDVFSDSISRQDQIFKSTVGVRKDAKNGLDYEFLHRNREEVINGMQHQLRLNQQLGPFQINSNNFYLKNQPNDMEATWLRLNETIQFTGINFQPGYTFNLDQHQRMVADSVASTLMNFVSHDFFVETHDSLRSKMRVDYIKRDDRIPVGGELVDYTEADEFRMMFDGNYDNNQVRLELNWRKVTEQLGSRETDRNLLGKIDYSGRMFNDLVKTALTYSFANSRELKRSFVYVPVPTGQGTHTWRDENGDGIQDLGEFYEAINPDERNYIKLFTPTDEYINAYQTTLVQSIDARLPSIWEEQGGVLKQLSRLSFNRNFRYNFKTTDNEIYERLVPFGKDLLDESLLFFRSLRRSTLFYNRNAPGLGFEISQSSQQSKSLLSRGFEINEREDWTSSFRIGFGPVFTVRSTLGIGSTFNYSDFLDNRNYNLNRNSAVLELIWQPMNVFRMIAGYERRSKNTVSSEQTGESGINEYRLETTLVRAGKGNLNASFHWLSIDFEGDRNNLLGYELLEALQPGNNQRWRVNWQQSLGNGLQLTLQYNGRKSADSQVIHTGNVQVTAYF